MRHLLIITLLFSTFVFSNCSGPAPVNNTSNATNTANTPNANQNVNKTNSNSPLGTTGTPVASTTNNGPTLGPVVQAFYQALSKKDEAGVKKYLSAAALKYYEDEGKTEKKSWMAFLLENEDPVDDKREVRNEKIDGDTAIVELKGGSLGVWTKIGFIKENGEWKFDSPDKVFKSLHDIRKQTPNANDRNG